MQFIGANGLVVADFEVQVTQSSNTTTAMDKFNEWCTELGITGGSAGSFNADDGFYVFDTDNEFSYNGVTFVKKFGYASEAGFGLYNTIPSNTLSTSTSIPNVNRMYVSVSYPILFFTFHPPGGDCRSEETQYKKNTNGFCIYAYHRRYSDTTYGLRVAIQVSASGIKFYFEKTTAGVTPLYLNTGNNSSWVNQYNIASIFADGNTRTEVTLTGLSYKPNGYIIFDNLQLDRDLRIGYEADIPNDTSLSLSVSIDGLNWENVDYGDIISSNISAIKVNLSTTDTSKTPKLTDLWLEEPNPPKDKILITFRPLSRFCTVEGDLTVTYDASKGNLAGEGGAVESFTQAFTPTDLIPEPNPGIQEYISVSPEIELEFLEVEYLIAYHRETITGAPAEPIVSLDYEYKVRKCWMEATTQLVKFNSSGQLLEESQNIILSVISKKLTSPVYTFKLVIDSVEYDGYITVSQDKTQLTVDMVSVLANFPSFTEATVKMTMVDVDLTINDYITLYKIQEGSTDVVAFLTNEYHDIVAMYDTQSVETEQKLAQAFSYIKVYQGFNDITDEYTFTKSEVSTKSLFYPTKNQLQIIKLEELNGQVTLTGTHPTLPTVNKTMTLKKDQRGLVVNP